MDYITAWVENPKNSKSLFVRFRDHKTKLPNGRWKVFTETLVDKKLRVFEDGKWKTAPVIANEIARKLEVDYVLNKRGRIDSSESLEKSVDDYLEDKKDLAWRTLVHYRGNLELMKQYFTSLDDLASKEKIGQWRDHLKVVPIKGGKKGYSINSIHGALNDVRMFCNWLVYKKKMSKSPFIKEAPQEKPIVPAQTKPRPRFYSINDFMKLEKVVATLDPIALRACRLAHDCGLRKVELVGDGVERLEGILWEDLIFNPDGTVNLLIRAEVTKGQKKERVVRVPETTLAILGPKGTGPICPIKPSHFDWVVKCALKIAGIKKMPGLFIHSFRHSLGKNFLQAGGKMEALQEILGHEDLETTRIYGQFEQSFLGDGVDRTAMKVELEKARLLLTGQISDISIEIVGKTDTNGHQKRQVNQINGFQNDI